MSARLFGTDGIRAPFGREPLTEPTVRRIGAALGALLAARDAEPLVLVGGDTRASTPALSRWIAAGLRAGGARPRELGTLPTGGVAHLVPVRGAAAGVVLSASHNPAEDNGIKLIDGGGSKWSEEAERRLEARIADQDDVADAGEATPERDPSARADYARWLRARLGDGSPLAGQRLALDFANGAASEMAALFSECGARVTPFADRPDGTNINRGCGATVPEALATTVRAGAFDLGFAFDGDADRAILVDERGEIRDGDAMLFLWARELARNGELPERTIVATSMSNLGLERALAAEGIGVVRCDVGDRAVVEALRARGLRLGGEQSGHLVDLERSGTGDGLLTALILADLVARSGAPASELLAPFRRFPQVLVNVAVRDKPDLLSLPAVAAAARHAEETLGAEGRLVLRYSGTEPLARVMLEGPEEEAISRLAGELAAAIRAAIGAA